jgi:predicted nucleic acid-binding protein
MPEVLVNTSPLQYLFQLGLLDLLPEQYGSVTAPEGVRREIEAGRERGVSLPHLDSLPWLQMARVQNVSTLDLVPDLGAGEREVLALALQLDDPLVILDDGLARRFAERLNLRLTGTLGVLLRAYQRGLLPSLSGVLDQLTRLNFRLDPATRASVLKIAGEIR